MRLVQCIFHKGVNMVLSMMAIFAVVFANCQCAGRAFEPELPDELQ